jgi:PKD repeat protein
MMNFTTHLHLKPAFLWVLLSFFTTISSIQAQTNFTGTTNNDWFTPTNWTNGLPAPGNDATIANDLTVNVTQPLTIDFKIELYNGGGNATTLNTNAPVIIKPSGTIASLGNLNFNDNVTNEGVINSFVKATLATGKTMTIAPSGALNVQNNSPLTLNGEVINNGTITNNGEITNNGTLTTNKTFDNYRIFNNNKSLIVTTDNSRFNSVNGSVINNKTGGSITVTGNKGTIVNEGTLTNDGSITINAQAELNSSSGFLINNKDIAVSGLLFNDRELKNTSTGTIHITSTGEYRGNANGTLLNEGTIKNDGKMDVLNKFENKTNAIFTNTSTATLSTQVGSAILNDGKFTNLGTLNSVGALVNNQDFENFGSFMSSSGAKIDNAKNFTNNGLLFNIEKINNNSSFINNGEINNSNGGVITNNANAYFLVSKTGIITNSESIVNKGTFDNDGLLSNKLRIENTGIFTNNGTFLNETNGDVTNKLGGTFRNNGVYNGYGGFINEANIANNNNFFVFGCGNLSNRTGGTIQNNGEMVADGGLIFQKSTLIGAPITNRNFGSTITSTSATTLCENAEVGLKQTGMLRATGTTIATPNLDPCQNIFLTIADADSTDFRIARYPRCNKIGTYPVTLKVVTRTGDEATCITNLSVVDKRAPLITGCPTDIVKTDVTGTGTTVAWVAPTAIDNCDGAITMTSNKQPGDNFPLGVTIVRYEAKDSHGNIGVCQFRVGVYGATNDKPCFIPKTLQLPVETCQNVPVAVTVLDPVSNFTYAIDFGTNATPATASGITGTASYSAEGQKIVRITASAPFCQSVSKDTALTVIDCNKPCVVPQPLALPTAICINGAANFTPTPLGTDFTYTWNFGSSSQAQLNTTGSPIVVKFNTLGQKTITLTVASAKCAATTKTYTTEVFDCSLPCATPSLNVPTEICQNAILPYTINNPQTNTNYLWNFGGDASPSVANGNMVYTKYNALGAKSIVLSVSGKTCASQTVTTPINVTACTLCPFPTVSNAPTNVCRGTAAIFKANDAGAGATYTWIFGEGATPATATGIGPHNVSYATSGAKTIALTSSGANCSPQSSLSTIAVTDCPCPTPDFTPIASSCKNKDVAFSLNSPSTGITYDWQLTDASVPSFTGTSRTVTYASAGAKLIKITASSPTCVAVSIIKGITINGCDVPCDIPAITTSVINDNACKDANVTVAANNPTATLTYTWDFGGGVTPATGVGVTNAIKYASLGEKTISLAITGSDCAPSSATKKINIKDCSLPCPTTEVVTPTKICSGTTHNFSASPIGGGYIYTWNFGTGATPATATGVGPHAVKLTGAGDKVVTLTITNEDGTCTNNIISRTVRVEDCAILCATPVISGDVTVCRTKNAIFNAPSLGNDFTYSWNFGLDATPVTGTGVGPNTVAYSTEGNKTVTLSVSGIYCATATTTAAINVIECNNPCPSPATITAPTRVCANTTQDFSTVPLTGNYTYTWDFGTGATPATATGAGIHKVTYATSGAKIVTLTIASPNAICVSTPVTRTIQVENCATPCAAPQITGETTACRTKTTTFSAPTLSTEFTYTWAFGAGATPATATGAGPHTVTYSELGNKSVTLSVSGTYCAAATATKSINIIECNNPCPSPTTITAPTRVCANTAQDFSTVALTGNYTYTWAFGTGATPATATGVGIHKVTYATSGAKTVTLTISNPDATCVGTPTSRTVQVEDCNAPCPAPAKITGEIVVCKDKATTYSTVSASNDYTYTWSFGTGATPATATGAGVQSIVFATEGAKTISVTAKGAFCAAATTTQAVTVNTCIVTIPACPTPVISSDATICMNKPLVFSANTIAGNYIYTWNFGTNATPTTATGAGPHNVTYTNAGAKTATLTLSGGQGVTCTATNATQSITVTDCTVVVIPPVPPVPTVTCTNNLTENASFENDLTGWRIWTPSSVAITTDKNSGAKAIRIGTAVGGFGSQTMMPATANNNFTVTIFGKIEGAANINFGYNFLDASDKVIGEGNTRITTTTYQKATLTAKAPANTAKLTIWFWKGNAEGIAYIDDICIVKEASTPINNCPTPVINSDATTCTNQAIAFATNTLGSNYIYTWSFGAGATPATATGTGVHNVKYNSIGTKNVTLTLSGGQGTTCAATVVTKNITITTCDTPTPTPTPTITCTNNLTENPSFENDFTGWKLWTPNTLTISTDKNSGSKAMRIGTNVGGFGTLNPVAVAANDNVSINLYGKIQGTTSMNFGYNFLDANLDKIGEGTAKITASTYQKYTLTAKAPATTASIILWFWKGDATGYVFIDDVCITKESAAPSTQCPTPSIKSENTACMAKATAFSTPNLGSNYTYTWNFGAGATPATATGIGMHNVTYSTIGTKTVTLTVSGGAGTICTAVNMTKEIAVFNCNMPSPAISCMGNLVQNPSFENDFANWSIWNPGSIVIVGDKNSGEKAIRIGNKQGGFAIQNPLNINGGDNVKINLYAKVEGNGYASFGYNFLDANGNRLEENTTPITSVAYQLYTKTIKAPANTTTMTLWLWKAGDTGALYIDDVCIAKDGNAPTPTPTPTPTCATPTLSKTPLTTCTNANAVVEATDLGAGYTYTWAFGAGATPLSSTGKGPITVKFANTGVQTISLTTNSAACGSKTVTQNITVNNCTIPPSNTDVISIISYPVNIQRSGNYVVKVAYTVSQTRDIKIHLINNSSTFGSSVRAQVQAGSGTVEIPFTVASTVPNGSTYTMVARILQVNVTPDNIIKFVASGNITVGNAPSTVRCITENGNLLREIWYNIGGKSVNELTSSDTYPSNANVIDYITNFSSPKTDITDNYGERVRGYIIPALSGKYTFFVTGDDEVQLFLSTTDNPDNKTLAAAVTGWTFEEELNKYGTQTSKTFELEAGKRYYTELLHKEGGFLDHFAVYWKGPGIAKPTIIASEYIAPWDNCANPRQSVVENTPFSVYPNPTSDYLFVDLALFKDRKVDIIVHNQFAQIVQEHSIPSVGSEPFSIDAQGLPSGVYYLQIRTQGRGTVLKRFVLVAAY